MASAKTVYGEISMQADTSPAHQPVPTNPSKEGFIRGLLSAMSPFGAKGRQPMPYVTVNMKSPYDRTERHRELLAMLAMLARCIRKLLARCIRELLALHSNYAQTGKQRHDHHHHHCDHDHHHHHHQHYHGR